MVSRIQDHGSHSTVSDSSRSLRILNEPNSPELLLGAGLRPGDHDLYSDDWWLAKVQKSARSINFQSKAYQRQNTADYDSHYVGVRGDMWGWGSLQILEFYGVGDLGQHTTIFTLEFVLFTCVLLNFK